MNGKKENDAGRIGIDKVTEGLRNCIQFKGRCRRCPYFTGPSKCDAILLDDTIALIERQKPVQPITVEYGTSFFLRCGCCYEIIASDANYCMKCGTKVKKDES